MSFWSKIVLCVAVLSLLIGGGILLSQIISGPPPPAEVAIAGALHDAQDAARNRDLGGVMELVSDDFKSGDWNKPKLRLYLARELRNSRGTNYDVHVNAPKILPSPTGAPDERMVVTQASVFWADTGDNIWGSNPITLVMREETRRKWLIFTEPRWRVISVAEMNLPGSNNLEPE